MLNIEAKYYIRNLAGLEKWLKESPFVKFTWSRLQTDIYYNCPNGRLKMRIVEGQPAELIGYQRADQALLRDSVYEIFRTPDGNSLDSVLKSSLGISVVVKKKRRLYLYKNVRIHLDEVERLGNFLELESVVSENIPRSQAQKNLDELLVWLGSFLGEIVPQSYSDLVKQIEEKEKDA
ncbi:MAG: hypothetical protein Kow0037_18060 [Calditrichia bacterium]